MQNDKPSVFYGAGGYASTFSDALTRNITPVCFYDGDEVKQR